MWTGLPPMDAPPSVQMLGEVDVNRNGAPPGGIHADLRDPVSAPERAAAPGMALLGNPLAVLALVALGFVALNARDRK